MISLEKENAFSFIHKLNTYKITSLKYALNTLSKSTFLAPFHPINAQDVKTLQKNDQAMTLTWSLNSIPISSIMNKIVEARQFILECQLDGSCRTVTMLGNNQISNASAICIFIIIFFAVNK